MTTRVFFPERSDTPRYRPDIDGLRAVAVASVLVFHAFPEAVPGGFVGVDVFFVISGFLISRILFDALEGNRLSLTRFYARRIRRLFPALLLVIVSSLAAGYFLMLASEFRQLGSHVFSGIFYVVNVVLLTESGYFDTSAHAKPLQHLWSLAVEEQFYIAWPILLYGFHYIRCVEPFLVGAAILSFTFNVVLVVGDPAAAFYLPFGRFWEFALGAMIARTNQRLPRGAASPIACLGSLLLVPAFFLLDGTDFPGFIALLPVLGAALLVFAGQDAWLNRTVLSHASLVGVGKISYPLYLWHWPLLAFPYLVLEEPSWSIRVLALTMGGVLATATFRWVEAPIRHSVSGVGLILLIVAAGGTGIAGALVSGGLVPPHSAGPSLAKIDAAVDDWSFPNGLEPFRFRDETFLRHGDSPQTVLFVGDSFMEQYWPKVEEVMRTQSGTKSVVFATRGGCPPFSQIVYGGRRDCAAYVEHVRALALGLNVETIVVAAWWSAYFNQDHEYELGRMRGSDLKERAFLDLEKWLSALVRESKKVIVILTSPYDRRFDPRHMVKRSLFGFAVDMSPVPRNEIAALTSRATLRMRAIADRAGANLVDPVELLCDAQQCAVATDDGIPLYKDQSHLRPFIVREKMTFFDKILTQ